MGQWRPLHRDVSPVANISASIHRGLVCSTPWIANTVVGNFSLAFANPSQQLTGLALLQRSTAVKPARTHFLSSAAKIGSKLREAQASDCLCTAV